jgi:hypothetical protein
MGINYTASLVYGYEIDENTVQAIWKKSKKDPGEFHMEDRFDTKTGQKLKQEKVWDRKPSIDTWYEMDGKVVEEPDPEDWEGFLSEIVGCHVTLSGSFPSGELSYVFRVNNSVGYKNADDYGHITIYNNAITQAELGRLMPAAMELKARLQKLGLQVNDPKIFITMMIS